MRTYKFSEFEFLKSELFFLKDNNFPYAGYST